MLGGGSVGSAGLWALMLKGGSPTATSESAQAVLFTTCTLSETPPEALWAARLESFFSMLAPLESMRVSASCHSTAVTYKSFELGRYLACSFQFLEDQLKRFSCNH